ncbi:MAG: sugar transferase [Acidobacteria bacterium]|nr:sugar transferase [Acidobacteriota bacterium]
MVQHAATVQSVRAKAIRHSIAWRVASITLLLLVDVCLAALAFILAYEIRQDAPILMWSPWQSWPIGIATDFQPYLSILLVAPVVNILALRRYGFYKLRGEFSFSGDLFRLIKASTWSLLILVFFAFIFRQGFSIRNGELIKNDFSYSRLVFFYDWVFSLAFFWATRVIVRLAQIFFRNHERNLIRTVVVGCGEMADVCIAEMSEKPRLGYKLVGVVTARRNEDASSIEKLGVRKLGSFDHLPDLVKRHGIEEVLITDSRISPGRMFHTLMECGRNHHIKYRVIPDLFDCLPGKTEIATIGSLPMIKLYEEPLRGSQKALKRSLDVLVALIVLLLTWPIWLVLAMLIKRESPGPAFLKQERVGMDGKMFLMIKFRSMHDGVDDQAHRDLMKKMINGEDVNQGTDHEPLYGKLKDDPRLTKIGSWMRRYSIDELPQMLNVLMGQMSIVGPRPPIPYEVRHYQDWHRSRFHVKPGITGLWQVSGRNRLHFEEMVRLDIFYIENWSVWLDLKIMFKTLPVMLRGDNTY